MLVPASSCKDKKKAHEATAKGSSTGGRVVVMVTADWEGHRLPPEGLEAIEAFENEWPALPITHYISAAYFTSPGQSRTAEQILALLRKQDEVGVHFHGWFSLVQASGVEPRATPNFYADDAPLLVVPDTGDKGYEVPLSAYSAEETAKLVAFSRTQLLDAGLPVGTSFRAGGYAASDATLRVLRELGFQSDSSSSWSGWFDESRGSFQEEVARHWPDLEELSQPFAIKTPAGSLVEVPNSGAFVEYVTTKEMLAHLHKAQELSVASGTTIYVGFGFHQDTADEHLDSLSDALHTFQDRNPEALHFATVTEVAQVTSQTSADAVQDE